MSLPKEPRQLMINLMYLVLTAMLALNVSSEILHAFKTINQSISASNASIEDKNNKLYEAMEEQANQPATRDRFLPFYNRATQIRSESEKVIQYLEEWKEKVIKESGGRDDDSSIKREDNIDASTYLLVDKKGGDEIKQTLTELRTQMLNAVNQNVRETFADELPIKIIEPERSDNNPQADWATGYFYNMPTMAVVTLLSKFQNDVRNSEAMVMNQLAAEAGDIVFKFDAFEAIAVPTTSYALEGQKIEAKILLAAYQKSVKPNVTASSGRVANVEDGVAFWEGTASGTGLQTVRGTVSIDMGSEVIKKDYSFDYMVGSTGASLQLDKMNVFYIGVPNPVTVSAAGYSLQDVSLNVPGGDVKQKELGKYDVTVSKPGEIVATINAKTKEGGVKPVGTLPIRVKFIPDPVAKIGGRTGGSMPANEFRAQIGILATLEAFDFDARFQVTEYKFSMVPKGRELLGPYQVNGPYLNRDQTVKELIDRARPGDRVFFDEIKAVGPDKRTRSLGSVVLTLY